MASSRGRERIRERQTSGKTFVFGSSTPRELSHMKGVPRKFRAYYAKAPVERTGPEIADVMRQARSLTPSGSDRGGWAFGSSTPRDLSHIIGVPKNMRIYNARVERPAGSMTRSVTVDQPRVRRPPPPPHSSSTLLKHVIDTEEDDVNSEPDLVQDRGDFFDEMRKKSREERVIREEANAQGREAKAASPTLPDRKEARKPPVLNQPADAPKPLLQTSTITTENTPETRFDRAPSIQLNKAQAVNLAHELHGASPLLLTTSATSAEGRNDQMTVNEVKTTTKKAIVAADVKVYEDVSTENSIRETEASTILKELVSKPKVDTETADDKPPSNADKQEDVLDGAHKSTNDQRRKTDEHLDDLGYPVSELENETANHLQATMNETSTVVVVNKIDQSTKLATDSGHSIVDSVEDTLDQIGNGTA